MINNIDINKIVVSNGICFGKRDFKYFIGYKDVKILELHVYFIQRFWELKYMSFFDKRWWIVREI